MFDYLPFGPFRTAEEFERWYDGRIRFDNTIVMFAIVLKAGEVTKPLLSDEGGPIKFSVEDGTFAGVTGYLETKPARSSIELGLVSTYRSQHCFSTLPVKVPKLDRC